ncbi:uncharacterized protein Z520_07021 [Fonsecaea multimorphosa CBS 102226]|uniref:Uncharacterized protein n=1 Tax=Fonsecaea multimorphosa CBS 102226 TaxID=1442371 RepID=A0A0D2KLL0_9EURO|nr:uncharacterized protein Z520_07021 [Fonsecaea multimorphosa CBS 102226]KIX97568.1 hypothetical protein Z520_07021 [Fonsecaea multimorphosa CBS 102226]OAL23525.1 hypothetical protein AYO22_06575 [Fonsecaea multimorphosa]
MDGSRSESSIDLVEEFSKDIGDLSKDENIKILTAGVNNMYSIAKCVRNLIAQNGGLKAYLTYQRLVKLLDFVWKSAQSFQNNVLESDLSKKQPNGLPGTLKGFGEVLDELKRNLPQEDIVEDTNKIPNSSAIELLLELFYKGIAKVPRNIYEFLLAFEARFGRYFTETNSCGLPKVVFICYKPGGVIVTASAVRWEIPLGNTKGLQYKRVNAKLREMRMKRFRSAPTEEEEAKFTQVKAANHRWQQGGQTMSRQLKDERFKPFKHRRRQAGAFHVLGGAGSILKIHNPCIKCRHLFRFKYIGQKATDNRRQRNTLWNYRNCAEDLCHEFCVKKEASDRKPDTSLC